MKRLVLFVLCIALVACDRTTGAASPPMGTGPRLSLKLMAKGLSSPVDLVTDGKRFFVVEQPGRIKRLDQGGSLKSAYLDISDDVTFQGECGFLGVAFHPDFATNGYFYVDYTTGRGSSLRTVIAEFHADPSADHVDPSTRRVLLEIPQPYPNHNGGQVRFGPDGMLYIGMGDGGSAGDPGNRAQNPQELLGKMLRIDVTSNRMPYAIPKDNPFVNDKRFRPEIWTLGMRNPWRFSFDRKTGACYAGDVGQNTWEEIDVLTSGGNYGWHLREARHEFKPERNAATNLIDPIVEYARDKGASVTGGVVYRGKKFPALDGIYIYADYVSGRFFGLRYESGKLLANDELRVTVDGKPTLNRVQPSAFGEDVEGEVYVCDHSHGNVYQVVAE